MAKQARLGHLAKSRRQKSYRLKKTMELHQVKNYIRLRTTAFDHLSSKKLSREERHCHNRYFFQMLCWICSEFGRDCKYIVLKLFFKVPIKGKKLHHVIYVEEL